VVDFAITPREVAISSKSYLFDKWVTHNGIPKSSPIQLDAPISLIAEYIPSIQCSISLSGQSSLLGDSVSLKGRIEPVPSNATLELWYSKDESSWQKISDTRVQSDGSFIVDWKPPVRGTVSIKASWSGDQEYAGSDSKAVVLTLSSDVSGQNLVSFPEILQQISKIENTVPSAKIVLLPLRPIILFSTSIWRPTSIQPWIHETAAYVIASALVGITYLTLPILLLIGLVKKLGGKIPSIEKSLACQLLAGLAIIIVAQLVKIPLLIMAGLIILVLATIVIFPMALATGMAKLISKISSL
jgi:hypothetical protein